MNYPTISDYKEAVKYTDKCFVTLHNFSVIENLDGSPIMYSSNDSVVFKMRDKGTGECYAVKCFLHDDEDRAGRYKDFINEMQYVRSEYFVQTRYLENEFNLHNSSDDKNSYPVVVMKWVEGESLDKYLEMYVGNEYPMRIITAQFCSFASCMLSQNLVHGNITADNILVRDDLSIVVIDYDNMSLRSKSSHISDDLSLVSLALSLKAVTLCPELYWKYVTDKNLLFHKDDYDEPFYSKVLKDVHSIDGDAEFKQLLGLFYIVLSKGNLNGVSPQLFKINCPEIKYNSLYDYFDAEDEDDWEDEFGVMYSSDGKNLKDVHNVNITEYKIKEGTRKICRCSFQACSNLTKVEIPFSVKVIEANPFCRTSLRHLVCNSPNYIVEDDFLLTEDRQTVVSYFGNKSTVVIPSSLRIIGDNAFCMCKTLVNVVIPESVTDIGGSAFSCCSLKKISIPDSVKKIGGFAFSDCSSLTDIVLPRPLKVVEENLFSDCINLKNVTIPSCVEVIEKNAFSGCSSLTDIIIPDSVTTIKYGAFSDCTVLRSIEIPRSVTNIESNPFCSTGLKNIVCSSPNYVFENKTLLTKDKTELVSYIGNERKYVVPSSVTVIGKGAFANCYTLYITVPSSVEIIQDYAFSHCPYLRNVELPSKLKYLGVSAFQECTMLESIDIPYGIDIILMDTFFLCSSLTNVTIPSSVTEIVGFAFSDCNALESVDIPSSVRTMSEYAFGSCSSLTSVIIRSPFMDMERGSFESCYSLSDILVPKGRGEYYRQLFMEMGNEDLAEIVKEG